MKHTINEANAERMATWIKERGGIAVWRSINLSNPGASWSTPALNTDGTSTGKPTWQAANEPEAVITDPNDVLVSTDVEVKRFRVGVRMGSQGFMVKVTDAGSRRIRAEVEKAGEGAHYTFDYETQQAVIWKPTSVLSLVEWQVKNRA